MSKRIVRLKLFILFISFMMAGCTPFPGVYTFGELREEVWLAPFDYWYSKIIWSFDDYEADTVVPEIEPSVLEKCKQALNSGVLCELVKQPTMDGGVTLLIETSGRGLEFLNLAVFDGRANVYRDSKGKVLIILSTPVRGLRYYSLSIHSGPIIESNATKQETFLAIWENPQKIQLETMTLYPVSLVPVIISRPLYLSIVLLIIMALLLIGLKIRKRG